MKLQRVNKSPWSGWILVLSLLAFTLRLFRLNEQSLWFDEAFSLTVAQADWPVFWAALLSDGVHPPGYYLLLRVVLYFLGSTEYAVRFPSVLAGTLAVPLIYRLGASLGGARWGLGAGLLLALNPFAIWYAQEARMYSLLLCLTIAGGYTFWKLVVSPSPIRWVRFALISALSFVSHYFAFVFSLVQFLYLVASLRQTHRVLRWWTAAQVVAFLPFLPWALAIANRDGRNFGIGWIASPSPIDLPLTLTNLTLALEDPSLPWTWAGLALVVGSLIGATTIPGGGQRAATYSADPARKRREQSRRNNRYPYVFLFLWLFIPPVLIWLVSLRLPLYVDRFFIICLPPLLLLISTISLSRTLISRGTISTLILASAVATAHFWLDSGLAKEDWRAAAAAVRRAEQPGDVLVMHSFQASIPFGYYYQGLLEMRVATLNRETIPLDELAVGHDRLWLVYRRPFAATHALAGSQPFTWQDVRNPVLYDWLVSHKPALTQEMIFPGVYVTLYELPQSFQSDRHRSDGRLNVRPFVSQIGPCLKNF